MMRTLKLFSFHDNEFEEKYPCKTVQLDRKLLEVFIVGPAVRLHAGETTEKVTYGSAGRPAVLYDFVNHGIYKEDFQKDLKECKPEVFDGVVLASVTMPGAPGSEKYGFHGKTLVHEVTNQRFYSFTSADLN